MKVYTLHLKRLVFGLLAMLTIFFIGGVGYLSKKANFTVESDSNSRPFPYIEQSTEASVEFGAQEYTGLRLNKETFSAVSVEGSFLRSELYSATNPIIDSDSYVFSTDQDFSVQIALLPKNSKNTMSFVVTLRSTVKDSTGHSFVVWYEGGTQGVYTPPVFLRSGEYVVNVTAVAPYDAQLQDQEYTLDIQIVESMPCNISSDFVINEQEEDLMEHPRKEILRVSHDGFLVPVKVEDGNINETLPPLNAGESMAIEGTTGGFLQVGQFYDEDVYSIKINNAQSLSISLHPSSGVDLDVLLYDPKSSVLKSGSSLSSAWGADTKGEAIYAKVERDHEYWLWVGERVSRERNGLGPLDSARYTVTICVN